MITKTHLKTLFIVGLCLFFNISHATDLAKEKRWADQIVDSILVGDPQWLTAGKTKFLSIYAENTSAKALGGAIILHGIGAHPNWDQVVRPLRTELPDYGWSTLSLQLPILANDVDFHDYAPLFPEVLPRINAAVAFLKAKGIHNIVIVAHSLGSVMGAYYLAHNPDPVVGAFVAIGASGNVFPKSDVDFLVSLKAIKVPVLDLSGTDDVATVMNSDKARVALARKIGNKNYTQVKIEGANHFFDGKNAVLVKRVHGWLANNAAGTEIKK